MQHLSSELKKIKKDNFGKILRHQSEKLEKLVKKKRGGASPTTYLF